MTPATKTGPFIEFGATMKDPSGLQLREDGTLSLDKERKPVREDSRRTGTVALWRVVESVFDARLQSPVGRSPDLHRVVVGLSCEELPDRIKHDSFDESLVSL